MTELALRPGPIGVQPLPRCCPSHADWATLTQHLVDDFPEVTVSDIVREVRQARDAVMTATLEGDEAMETGELIARHQLMMLAGHIVEMARLDPETHVRAGT